ncbi:MAG: hypothetical protein Q4G49_09885 [Paracoccus sp. (in: a-proteobacteria)]|nr:hypothetical protein [Paracoccus sp. (in: a-proteobacteria)]
MPTKLVHYTMAFWPELALAAAMVWLCGAPAGRVSRGIGTALILTGPLLLTAAILIGQDHGRGWCPGIAALIAGWLLTGLAARALWADARPVFLGLLMAGGAVLTSGILLTAAHIPALWPSRLAVAEAQRVSPCARPTLIGWGYAEPSLIWLAGTDTTQLIPGEAPLPPLPPCAVVIRDSRASAPVPAGRHEAATISPLFSGRRPFGAADTVDCGE